MGAVLVGSTAPARILIGGTSVKKVYVGSTQVWTAPAAQPTLHVSGSNLVADDQPSGTVFKVGGFTSYGMTIYREAGATGGYNHDYANRVYPLRDTWLANLKAEGYNLHRLSVAGAFWNTLPYFGMTQTQYLDRVEAYVDSGIALGMRTLIGDWSSLVTFKSYLPERWEELKPFWTALVQRLGPDNPWVVYEPHNEPNNEDVLYHGVQHAQMTNSQWQTVMAGTISHFRSLGYQGPLVIDTPDWSWQFPKTQIDALLAHDASLRSGQPYAPGQHQLVIANHLYSNGQQSYNTTVVNGAGESRRQEWERTIYARVLEGYPVLGSEYGYANGAYPPDDQWQREFFGHLETAYVPNGMIGFCNFVAGTWGEGGDGNRTHMNDQCSTRTLWGGISMETAQAVTASNAVTAPTAPEPPVIGTATAGNGSASVAFTRGDGGAPTLYRATSSGGQTASGIASPISVLGLTNGTSYTFTVTAENSAGTSGPSAPSNAVTPSSGAQQAIYEQGFEANAAGWASKSNTTVTHSTLRARTGAGALRAVAVANGNAEVTGVNAGVEPSKATTVALWVWCSVGRTVQAFADEKTAGGAQYLGNKGGSFTSVPAQTWTEVLVSLTTTATTGVVVPSVAVYAAAAGEDFFVDDARITQV